ncbi:MAG: LysM peptidoglycan-binding domain-containing protein [Clostridia bacterium]|nr:LysM peptidoglycan-binding domain-containing protein [Clostridia bacterium]
MIKNLGKNKHFCSTILHQIKPNETYESIAKLYGTSAHFIRQQNPHPLRVGDCLVLKDINKTFYVVKPCETLEIIARKTNTSIENLKQKNKITVHFVGQMLEI